VVVAKSRLFFFGPPCTFFHTAINLTMISSSFALVITFSARKMVIIRVIS
jgi:hypothetical protein